MKKDLFQKALAARTGKDILDLSTGKVKADPQEKKHTPPGNAVEEKLFAMWKKLLGHQEFGTSDSFFLVGGNSLKATQLMSRITNAFSVTVALKDIFDHPTIGEQAAKFGSVVTKETHTGIGNRERPALLPLSFSQERLWFIDQLEGGSTQYHVSNVFRLQGALNKDAFEKAIRDIVNRHEILRTVIRQIDGQPYQHILDKDGWNLSCEPADSSDETALRNRITTLVNLPFDLSADHMVRAFLLEQASPEHTSPEHTPRESLLVLTLHHISSDGWSSGILLKELATLYKAYTSDQPSTLPVLSAQYADYALWQQEELRGAVLDTKLSYWKEKLAGVETLQLPTDHIRPAMQSTRGATLTFEIEETLTASLRQLSHEHEVTLFMTLLCAFKVLLYRYSGQEDICVGTPIANRTSQEVEGLIGFFANTLVFRSDLGNNPTFLTLLQEIRKTTLDAYTYQDVPFEKIVEAVVSERDLSRNPLVQVLFEWQEIARQMDWHVDDLVLSPMPVAKATSRLDLSFSIKAGPAGWRGEVEYCTDLFDAATILRMISHYKRLLQAIVNSPDAHISSLDILSTTEHDQLTIGFNDTAGDCPPDTTVVSLLAQQANQKPDALAAVFEGRSLSFADLEEQSDQVAHYLLTQGIKTGDVVPLCIDRSLEMLLCIWGIFKSGAVYVPIDPSYPPERIRYYLEDLSPALILTGAAQEILIRDIQKEKNTPVINITSIGLPTLQQPSTQPQSTAQPQSPTQPQPPTQPQQPSGQSQPSTQPQSQTQPQSRTQPEQPAPSPHDLAYIIYTSGSTGQPKGVMISHANLVNFVFGMNRVLPLTTSDHVLAITSMSFDISLLELIWTVCQGIPVTINPDHRPGDLDRYCGDDNLTEMDFSLFFFASKADRTERNKYDFLLDAVRFGDQNGFSGVWLPERHFHAFGGIFPNPAVLAAGLATITQNIELRSGSVVLPLHDIVRVAEEWSVVDNLSDGRIALSVTAGWHADDFVLMPGNYARRQAVMYEQIDELKTLWNGGSIKRMNGSGKEIDISIFPGPVKKDLKLWVTSKGNAETFYSAGKIGANILTHFLGQDIEELKENIIIYKRARRAHGHSLEQAKITLMLHTYLGEDQEQVKEDVKEPFKAYLRSSISLLKNLAKSRNIEIDNLENIEKESMNDLLDLAFERYWQTAALLGTKESCSHLIQQLAAIGVTEIGCLIDFGVETAKVTDSLRHLNELRKLFHKQPPTAIEDQQANNKEQLTRAIPLISAAPPISAIQLTPSYLGMLLEDPHSQHFLKQLKYIIAGGEKLPEAVRDKLLLHTDAALYNVYGPTETTIWSASTELTTKDKITIGKPLLNTQLYIRNPYGALCPAGVYGEIYIGGKGVSRGYLHKAELTRERFLPHPFSAEEDAKLYRTGDIGRWQTDGEIELLGRNDEQIKLNGHRIELGEIEYALAGCKGVKASVTALRTDAKGNRLLVAYVQTAAGYDNGAVYAQLRKQLPEYMIPSLIMELGTFPLTSNGKINRKALPDPEVSAMPGAVFRAPVSPTEINLAAIWQELLPITKVSVHDNFFRSGGNSLLAVRLMSAIRSKIGWEVSIKNIFEYPTISALAEKFSDVVTDPTRARIGDKERPALLPLSFSQERLWFIDQLEGGSTQYHVSSVFRLKGDLNKPAFEQAIRDIVNRHEILRTVIRQSDGRPYQHILDKNSWQLNTIGAITNTDETALRKYITTLVNLPFDLSTDHMLRAFLLEPTPPAHNTPPALNIPAHTPAHNTTHNTPAHNAQEHILILTVHHISSDGWSSSILLKELAALYDAYSSGQPATLRPLPVQYADYALWQQEELQGATLETKLSYWKEKLTGVETLQLPTDHVRPVMQSTRGATLTFEIEEPLTASLRQLSREQEVTLFMTLLCAFKVLLYRYSGQEDICVGTLIANRTRQEVEGLIGFFANTLVLRSDLGGNPAFLTLLQEIRKTTLDAYTYQDVPFEKIVEAVVRERDLSRNPLVQVLFELPNYELPDINNEKTGNLQWSLVPFDRITTKFDLTFRLEERDNKLYGYVEYGTDLYEEDTIHRMMTHYVQLLQVITADPQGQIAGFQLLAQEERHRLLVTFNDTKVAYPQEQTIVTLFRQQATRIPDHCAITARNTRLSYRELELHSNQLAHYLKSKGVREESIVPISMKRSPDMMVAILAIFKTGAAYVPIDPGLPAERISYMIADVGADVVIVNDADTLPPTVREQSIVISLQAEADDIGQQAEHMPDTPPKPDNLAYIIYTSGSTGRPKGAMVEHAGMLNHLYSKINELGIHADSRIAQTASFTFDISVWQMWASLLCGGMVFMYDDELIHQPLQLMHHLQEDRITILELVPSYLPPLLEESPLPTLDSLQCLVVTGEAAPPMVINKWLAVYPHVKVVNAYGPTEASDDICHYHMDKPVTTLTVPIGRPVQNMSIYIVNGAGALCPIGVAGEIWVAGIGVGRGYWKDEAGTRKSFGKDPFNNTPTRLYHTGDSGRWLKDGNIEYLGRLDDQVKINGHRIELQEIESILEQSPLVSQAVILVRTDEKGHRQLVGYAIPTTPGKPASSGKLPESTTPTPELNKEAIIDYLRDRLPGYMVPQIWIRLDKLPLTPHGKIDKQALLAMDTGPHPGETYIPPHNETEQTFADIWSDLLGIAQVSIHDNFFEIGGDSIITIQVVSRARRKGYVIQARDIFMHQTIASLSAALQKNKGIEIFGEQGLLTGECGLLPIQSWYFEVDQQPVSYYNQSILLNISRSVDKAALDDVFEKLGEHHDSLRFRFTRTDNGWIQTYSQQTPAVISLDLSNTPPDTLNFNQVAETYQHALDIEAAMPVKIVLIQTPETLNDNRLLIIAHHLVIDGVSWRILLEDLDALLGDRMKDGHTPGLGKKGSSFRDWFRALETYASSMHLQLQKHYWEKIAQNTSSLPTDKGQGTTIRIKDIRNHTVALDAANTTRLLKETSRAYHTEINDLLLAALARTICSWSRNETLVIGLEGHGREHIEEGIDISRTVGWFTNLYPVLLHIAGEQSPGDLVISVKEQMRRIPDKGMGYGVLKYINREKTLQEQPEADIVFNYLGQLDHVMKENALFSVSTESTGNNTHGNHLVREKISINAAVQKGRLLLSWHYSSGHFEASTIQELAQRYLDNLNQLIDHCAQQGSQQIVFTPSDFGLANEVEYKQLDRFLSDNKENKQNILSF